MRLLNVTTWKLESFDHASCIPPYITVSHCWDKDEIVYDDMAGLDSATERASFSKFRNAGRIATSLGIPWIWIDTVCINRSSTTELTEAVNSSFRWFRDSNTCIVYLDDLTYEPTANEQDLEIALRRCRWMRRCWTLQELIAPPRVKFYDSEWRFIGSKKSLLHILSRITRVNEEVLEDANCLAEYAVGVRMSWAAHRLAHRIEDMAYSLIGIFDVSMPIIYGEGVRSFLRLQEEILKYIDDATLFAWQAYGSQMYRGLFASSPSEFSHFTTLSTTKSSRLQGLVCTTSSGVIIESLFWIDNAHKAVILGISVEDTDLSTSKCMGVLLREWNGYFVRYSPQTILKLHDLPFGTPAKLLVKRDITPRDSRVIGMDLASAESHYLHTMPIHRNGSKSRMILAANSNAHSQPENTRQLPSVNLQFQREQYSSTGMTYPESPPAAWLSGLNTTAPSSVYNVSGSRVTGPSKLIIGKESQWAPDIHVVDKEASPSLQGTDSDSDDSIDEDMYLFQDLAPRWERPHSDHPFHQIKDALTKFAITEFSSVIVQDASSNGKRARQDSPDPARKRLRSFTGSCVTMDQDSEDDETVVVGYKHPPEATAFACPYYVRSPSTHQSCLKQVHLRHISEVKQHIWRDHRRPPFCPICHSTFETHAACDAHIIKRGCNSKTTSEIEGMSYHQLELLTKRLSPQLSAKQQWRAIWDIVFPNAQHPEEIYLSGALESVVCMLREYWSCNGKRVITQFIDAEDMCDYADFEEHENALEWLFSAVLADMIDTVVDQLAMIECQGTNRSSDKTQEVLDMLRKVCIRNTSL